MTWCIYLQSFEKIHRWVFLVTVRKLNVTDRQTDRQTGALQYLPSRAFGAAGDKKRKSYWSVSEIGPSPPPSILTDRRTNRRTDYGQLGIRKAPLPFGTAELKISNLATQWNYSNLNALDHYQEMIHNDSDISFLDTSKAGNKNIFVK